MRPQPTGSAPAGSTPEGSGVEKEFRSLADEWLAGMGFSSNPQKLMSHPAFQGIVALGMPAVPLLLREIQARPTLLVWALPEITKADPVPSASRGKIAEMARAWVGWGQENHYI